MTWEKILETSKVREAISQNSLFELILTESGWFLVPRLKNHYTASTNKNPLWNKKAPPHIKGNFREAEKIFYTQKPTNSEN